jgi:hypothetical protein
MAALVVAAGEREGRGGGGRSKESALVHRCSP